MEIKVEIFCPLGKVCQEVKDGAVHRCAWYTKLVGKHPQKEGEFDEWGCAIAWMPILSVEMSQTNRGQTQALESFRNEVAKGSASLLTAVGAAGLRRINHDDG